MLVILLMIYIAVGIVAAIIDYKLTERDLNVDAVLTDSKAVD